MATNSNIVAAIASSGGLTTSNPHAENINRSGLEAHEKGRGKAVRGGPTLTPEATPEPEDARNEADRRRVQEEEQEEQQSTDNQTTGDKDQGDLAENSKTGRQAEGRSSEKKTPVTKTLQASVAEEEDDQTAGDNSQGDLAENSKTGRQAEGRSSEKKTPVTKTLQASVAEEEDDQTAGDNSQGDLAENSKTGRQAEGRSSEKKTPVTKTLQASVAEEEDDQTAGDNSQGALVQSGKTKQQVQRKPAKKETKPTKEKTTTAKPPRNDEASGNESDGLFVGSGASPQKSSETDADKKREEKKEEKSWTDKQEKEIERILGVPPNHHFQVLGIRGILDAREAPSAYRKLAVQVHPDKNKHPKAKEAFERLKAAADAYGIPEEVEVGESFLDDEGNPMELDGSDNEGDGDSDDENDGDQDGTESAAPNPAKESATSNPAKATSSPKPATKWKPGLTEKGERIMAMAPTETTDVLGNPTMTRCLFLVEKKGQKNPIVFEDAADVGEKAARGYLEQLPKTERIDIRTKMNSYSPKDRKGFVRIKGVAAKEGDNPRRYPDCAVWVEYEDGSYKFPNRSGCRAIWKSKADRMIEDFFLDNELEIPWLKKAKRPYQTDVLKDRSTRAGSSRTREAPWRARSPERGRSSRSPDRRRSSSISSSASYLSDEGLERLEGIEERMSKFEELFMRMDKKLDAMSKKTSRN